MQRRYLHNFCFTTENYGVAIDELLLDAIEYLKQCKNINIEVTGDYTPCPNNLTGKLPKAIAEPVKKEEGNVSLQEFNALISVMAKEIGVLKGELQKLKDKN